MLINLILTLAMSSTQPAAAQFKPCVWPNVCKTPAPVQVAQFQPCVWPRTCKSKKAAKPVIAQFETCVFPKKCGKSA